MIQNVRVLGMDLNADLASNKPATPNTATLEVSVPDAQKLAVASDLGKLSLALRKTGAAEVAQTAPMRAANFVGGGKPRATEEQNMPRGPVRRRTAPDPSSSKVAEPATTVPRRQAEAGRRTASRSRAGLPRRRTP